MKYLPVETRQKIICPLCLAATDTGFIKSGDSSTGLRHERKHEKHLKSWAVGDSSKKVELELQQKFSVFVEHVHGQKLKIQCSLDELETLKKALFQEYFT